MKSERAPKRNHMEEYNSAIEEQDKLLDTIHKFQWDNASTHTKAEAQAAKQMRDNVLAYKKKLEHDKVNANPMDAHAYARGTGGVSDYDKGMQHAMGNVGDGSRAEQVRKALEGYDKGMLNAYGNIGDGLKAEQEREASYNTGMQHAMGGSGKPNNPNAALGAKEQQINQKLDEIVNGQDLSETAQGKLQEDLQKLNAEKNVIAWQQQNPNATQEDFDSKNDYFGEMINRAADDYLNEWGGKDTAESKEAFAEYSEKVHGIVAQRDANNRAAMGVLDTGNGAGQESIKVTDFGEDDTSGFGNSIEVTDFGEKDTSGFALESDVIDEDIRDGEQAHGNESLYDYTDYDDISDDGLREVLIAKNKDVKVADSAIQKVMDELQDEGLSYSEKGILYNELRSLEHERANFISMLDKGITVEEENVLRAKEISSELSNLEADYMNGRIDDEEYDERLTSLMDQKMQLSLPPQPPLYTVSDPSSFSIFSTHPYDESTTHPYAEYEENNGGLSADANGLFDVSALYENGEKYIGKDSFTLSVIDAIANGTFPVGTNLMVQFALQYDGSEEWGDQVSQMGDEVQLPYTDNSNLDESSDCSSFVGNMYEMFFGEGFLYGSYTESQFNDLVKKEVYQPSLDELRPGDLLYYKLSDRNPNATHVAMYIGKDEEGNDLIIHTYGDDSSETRLHVETLDDYNDSLKKGTPRGDLISGTFRVLSDEQYKSLIVDYPI